MQIGLLGPVTVLDDAGMPLPVAGTRLRTLLARLAVDPGRPVAVSTLVDAVWGDEPPADEANALQTLVSRLRRLLGGPAVVAQSPAGYRLVLPDDAVDTVRLRRAVREAADALRAGAADTALRAYDEAADLVRGRPLDDLRDTVPALAPSAAALDDEVLAMLVARADAQLTHSPSTVDVVTLERLAMQHPVHEPVAAVLLRALDATGRHPDALRAYDALRRRLADELGVDPSPELQALHLDLLRGTPDDRPSRPTNLRAGLTTFVGRDDEVALIGDLLTRHRLVTLVGPGGAGKTRLATEAAARVADLAPDGLWLVELAPVTAAGDVPQAVLSTAGLREVHVVDRRASSPARDAMSRLRDALGDRRALLVLDNCEHVIDAAARLCEDLLSACPGLRVLATSREALAVPAEALLAVPPLASPRAGVTPQEAQDFAAVRLFLDRARAVRPGFELDAGSLGPVVEIVTRLDGLPLAIELAAARFRTMPLTEIAARLDDRFRLLTGGSRTALPRHRTLRAVVEWSWTLLTDDERLLAEALAVFPGGFTEDAAVAVRPKDVAAGGVADLLTALVEKSLVQSVGERGRYRMLETIREYGVERLADRGELAAARAAHADHYQAFVAEAEPHLTTAGQLPWIGRLAEERENILAALRYRCDSGEADAALRLAISLGGWAIMLGEHSDMQELLTLALGLPDGDPALRLYARALAAVDASAGPGASEADEYEDPGALAEEIAQVPPPGGVMAALLPPVLAFFGGRVDLGQEMADRLLAGDDPWLRAATHMFLASFAENQGDVASMRLHTDAALAGFRAIGERWGLASAVRLAAQLDTLDGRLEQAEQRYREALTYLSELNSREDAVFFNHRIADLALRRGDLDAAREALAAARSTADEFRAPLETLFLSVLLSDLERRTGDPDAAEARLRQALVEAERIPPHHPAMGHAHAMVLTMAAHAALARGDRAEARTLVARAREHALATRDRPIIASVVVLVAELRRVAGDATGAAELLGAAATVRGADDPTALDVTAVRTALVAELGEDAVDAAYERGRALPMEAALARSDDPD